MKSTFAKIPMVKQLVSVIFALVFFSSCTALKQMNIAGNRPVSTVNESAPTAKTKFIEEITITPQTKKTESDMPDIWDAAKAKKAAPPAEKPAVKFEAPAPVNEPARENIFAARTPEVESASSIHFKYALLLNTEVESLPNKTLLDAVDEWYGVRYRSGGTTKSGVDCSGFTVAVYAAAYGMMLPRISRDQYHMSRKISITELKEGDLVFFNTNGRGVSHVGVYLGNNHFIHASVSRGVMVSDLFETYYLKRFVGAGRIDDKQIVSNR
jgi:lipoprotein Spr